LAIIAGTKISTTMVVLILPITDFGWVIVERIKDGQPIFRRDEKKRHLHYKLLGLGLSPKQILLGYGFFLSGSLLVSFFVVNQTQKIILLTIEFVMIFLFMLSLSKGLNFKEIGSRTKKILLNPVWFIVVVTIGLIFFGVQQKKTSENSFRPDALVSIDKKDILKIKIVQTPQETYKGLGGVDFLPAKNGMLFIYSQSSSCSHVMRGMKFDLDFIFLLDNEVVSIQEKIPQSFEGIIQSSVDCNQVLEVNAGEIEQLGVEIGDKIEVKKGDLLNL
jgi:uncharacterized membrane protein (UPF0127 family)